MEFSDKMYIGSNAAEKIDQIKNRLIKNEFVPFVHVITLPLTDDGVLEIYPAYILRQKLYQSMPIKVVGIAADHGEACRLVQQMADDCMRATGSVDLRNYLKF